MNYIVDNSGCLTSLQDVKELESQETRPRCWMERTRIDIFLVPLLAPEKERNMDFVLVVVAALEVLIGSLSRSGSGGIRISACGVWFACL